MWHLLIPIIHLHISCHVSADIYMEVNLALHFTNNFIHLDNNKKI